MLKPKHLHNHLERQLYVISEFQRPQTLPHFSVNCFGCNESK
jgi:hypothetical protein